VSGDPVDTFRQEAQELLEQIEQGLLNLGEHPDDRDLIDAVFRGLHTLKGSGAMFGFDDLAAFTHHCEGAFDRVRKGEVEATPDLVAAVLEAQDHMRALAEGRDVEPGAGDAFLAQLHEALETALQKGSPAETSAETSPDLKTWTIRFSLPLNALANGVRPLPLLDELRALGDCQVIADTGAVPTLDALDPTQCHLAWSVTLTTAEPKSAIEDVFIFVIDEMTLEITEAGAALDETLESAPVQDAISLPTTSAAKPEAAPEHPTPVAANEAKSGRAGETVRVPAERLDELMDRVGELVIAQSRLKQVAANSTEPQLRAVAEDIERLAGELRDTMMVVRMVSVIQLFGRYRRLVHNLARDTGKAITLATEGETTELDKTVIEQLADPLVHLIRNAADHGLESEAERLAAGKPAAGQITLSAAQAGAEVIITIADDGKGVDRARVRAKAEEAGQNAPGDVVSDDELLQFIFHPGFSTAQTVTNLSGRGVGMDVVKRAIEALRGSIRLSSEPGKGSQIALRIPLTLAIIDGLLVRVGEARYVIPLPAVEECVELSAEQDLRSTGRSFITLRDQLVPFIRLRQLFANGLAPEPHQKVVVVSNGEERVGLVVDQILGDHQTVIKTLSGLHANVETFSGATILGDGGVALILDVAHLVAAGQRHDAQLRAAG
jgi:two-component system chemotaxis sensor kinase CheA